VSHPSPPLICIFNNKVKVFFQLTNCALCHEGIWGSGRIDPHILYLGTVTPWPLYPRQQSPGTHWMGGWMDPRAGVDDVEKRKFLISQGLEFWPSVVQPIASRYTDWDLPAVFNLVRNSFRFCYNLNLELNMTSPMDLNWCDCPCYAPVRRDQTEIRGTNLVWMPSYKISLKSDVETQDGQINRSRFIYEFHAYSR
jgi:hypothetical protein